jgi:hypothetical protein
MTIVFSRRLALAAGFALPVVETIRRWHQLGDLASWPFWLDDWCIGAFLLYGVWRTRPGQALVRGHPVLAAAWGFACGQGYTSFFGQLGALSQPDPSGVASRTVVAIKGVMFALGIVALVVTLRWKPPGPDAAIVEPPRR